MKFEKISDIYKGAVLECYIHDDHEELRISERRGIIICPGGGYSFLSEREAEPIALQFFAAGLNAFVLRYSVGEDASNYTPLVQALLSVKYLRENSEKYHLIKNRIFICGFSAGGHLAASAGTMFDIPEIGKYVGQDRQSCRPDGMVLCYPVITGVGKTHAGSIQKVSGSEEPSESMKERFSCELHVSDDTPPAFLWHTASDPVVPVTNTLLFASALAEQGIPFEVHIYPKGNHGLALCNKETWSQYESHINRYAQEWIEYAVRFVKTFPEFVS